MAVTTPEVVKASLVLVGLRLLGTPKDLEGFKQAIGTDVQMIGAGLIANIPSGITEPGHTLALNRDRITLDLSQSRSTINRDYPLREDLHRLAKVAWQAIGNTSLARTQPRVIGFNIEMFFDQDSGIPAFEYLSKRLFDVGPLGNEGWQFVGGAGRLMFDDGGRQWTINLEPRFNDKTESRIFLSVNLHMGSQTLPDEVGIRAYLEELWDKVHDFVQRLDNREASNG